MASTAVELMERLFKENAVRLLEIQSNGPPVKRCSSPTLSKLPCRLILMAQWLEGIEPSSDFAVDAWSHRATFQW